MLLQNTIKYIVFYDTWMDDLLLQSAAISLLYIIFVGFLNEYVYRVVSSWQQLGTITHTMEEQLQFMQNHNRESNKTSFIASNPMQSLKSQLRNPTYYGFHV